MDAPSYNVIILLVTYMLPIASMSYTYFRVGRELWGSQSIGECTAAQMESIKSKRKVIRKFCKWIIIIIISIVIILFDSVPDCQNDDDCGGDIRCLLGTISYLFSARSSLSGDY